mmetsp:Transcript_23727/g.53543  ORF Transcript_23727/g.53543 Transcript_23727/m.53543 type:complete len:333 (+) Transcript_23727:334-1332(+)
MGLHGPSLLPTRLYWVFSTLLTGSSVMSTALVALYLREEARARQTRTPRRSIWGEHRLKIFVLFIVMVLPEIFGILMSSFLYVLLPAGVMDFSDSIWFWSVVTYFVSIPIQLVVATFFFHVASEFRSFIKEYLWPPSRAPSINERTLLAIRISGQMSFWLAFSASCMIISALTSLYLFVSLWFLASPDNPRDLRMDFALLCVWCFSRVGISFAHVKALRPVRPCSSARRPEKVCRNLLGKPVAMPVADERVEANRHRDLTPGDMLSIASARPARNNPVSSWESVTSQAGPKMTADEVPRASTGSAEESSSPPMHAVYENSVASWSSIDKEVP